MSSVDEPFSDDHQLVDPISRESPWRSYVRRPVQWIDRNRFQITLSFLIATFTVVALWREVVVANYSGEQSVYWSRFFGGTSNRILGEGVHFKFPWDEIVVYNVRVMEVHDKTGMLTSDGMEINVEWSARYRVEPLKLPLLHREVGPRYADKVIIPEVISSIRQVLGNYTAEQIYARDEAGLIKELDTRAREAVRQNHPLILERLVLTRLDLPTAMAKGIVEKLLVEQNLLAYRFRLGAEEAERKRKLIEAQGIREFEQITGVSILKWRGIDATQELAKSPNTKIVIMGTGQNSLPVLLNVDQTGPSIPVGTTSSVPISRNTVLPNKMSGAQ